MRDCWHFKNRRLELKWHNAGFAQARRSFVLLRGMRESRGRMADGWTTPHCPSGRECVHWVHRYFRDCVCGVRDDLSVGFGLISVFSWGVAEVPQIVTNFKSRSTEGVSLGFLMTWIVGDLFNLIGCLLDPATLPTQFYTAALYTLTTLILVLQTIYYGHVCKCLKVRKMKSTMKKQPQHSSKEFDQNYDGSKKPMNVGVESKKNSTKLSKSSLVEGAPPIQSLPIPATSSPQHKDIYYTSARSLASSHTPTAGSYLLASRGSGRSGPSYTLNQSSIEEGEGLLTNYLATTSPTNTKSALLRVVVGSTFFISGLNLHMHAYNTATSPTHARLMESGFVIHSGRKLLQEVSGVTFKTQLKQDDESISTLGTYLGWLMAAIYMGGRLPQICLNVKRGTVEGLNPLMFMFALLGNVTYVGSIIVRTLEWERLKANMPWLVDAAVCVLLDLFILSQFIYYQTRKDAKYADDNGDYEEAK